jgi:hypothetical protein
VEQELGKLFVCNLRATSGRTPMKPLLKAPYYLEKALFQLHLTALCMHQPEADATGTPQDVAFTMIFCMQNAPHWGLTGHTP